MKKIINPWKNMEGYNCFGCSPDNESQIFDFQRFAFYIFSYPYILISKPKDNISFSNNISCFLLFS